MISEEKELIEIRHQLTNELFEFKVVDKNSLTSFEVITICTKMQCQALLVQGHYYRL